MSQRISSTYHSKFGIKIWIHPKLIVSPCTSTRPSTFTRNTFHISAVLRSTPSSKDRTAHNRVAHQPSARRNRHKMTVIAAIITFHKTPKHRFVLLSTLVLSEANHVDSYVVLL